MGAGKRFTPCCDRQNEGFEAAHRAGQWEVFGGQISWTASPNRSGRPHTQPLEASSASHAPTSRVAGVAHVAALAPSPLRRMWQPPRRCRPGSKGTQAHCRRWSARDRLLVPARTSEKISGHRPGPSPGPKVRKIRPIRRLLRWHANYAGLGHALVLDVAAGGVEGRYRAEAVPMDRPCSRSSRATAEPSIRS